MMYINNMVCCAWDEFVGLNSAQFSIKRFSEWFEKQKGNLGAAMLFSGAWGNDAHGIITNERVIKNRCERLKDWLAENVGDVYEFPDFKNVSGSNIISFVCIFTFDRPPESDDDEWNLR